MHFLVVREGASDACVRSPSLEGVPVPAFVVTPDHYPDHEPGTAILGVDAEPQAPAHLIPQAADGEWDEETLEELAARIQEAHVAVARASAAVVAFAVTAGRLLLKARAARAGGLVGAVAGVQLQIQRPDCTGLHADRPRLRREIDRSAACCG